MLIKDIVMKLEESKVFKDWRKKQKKPFLCSLFAIKEGIFLNDWIISYYDAAKDRMISFEVGENVRQKPASEVLHVSAKIVLLDPGKADAETAVESAEKFFAKEYPQDAPLKTILILQGAKKSAVWTMTFITRNFNTVTMKMDASTLKILEHNCTPIFSFVRPDDGK